MIDLIDKMRWRKGFWLVGAHNTPKLGEDKLKYISQHFVLVETVDYLDAWAQLYESKIRSIREYKEVEFDSTHFFNLNNEKVLAFWGGSIHSLPFQLYKGKYKMKITSRGTPSLNEFPNINVLINDSLIGHFTATEKTSNAEFSFNVTTQKNIVKLQMTNDYADLVAKEDRNLFVSKILIYKLNP